MCPTCREGRWALEYPNRCGTMDAMWPCLYRNIQKRWLSNRTLSARLCATESPHSDGGLRAHQTSVLQMHSTDRIPEASEQR